MITTIPQKPKKRRLKSFVVALVFFAFGIFLIVRYLSVPDVSRAGSFEIKEGEGASVVATHLADAGIIRSRMLFLVKLRDLNLEQSLRPGIHDLSGIQTYADIAEALSSNQANQSEVTLTIKEGWTLRDIKKELARLGLPAADEFDDFAGRPTQDDFRLPKGFAEDFPFLLEREAGTSLEGYLFPDTYRFFPDADAETVVRTLLKNYGTRVDSELQRQINASGHSFGEVMTIASILEREVRTEETRRNVADIFWRRLEIGMALQADSTVNYVIGGNSPAVSLADLEVQSPYNTYRQRGLPPGPIGNPGVMAIRAAVTPAANDWWYFLTDDEGRVYYAETHDEHVRNKNLYLR